MSTSSPTGSKRLGKYELRERIGHGSMAEVWKAHDPKLERDVAIKLLQADLRTDPDFMTRFSREARSVAKMHHPNIVQIYDFQTTQFPETNEPIAYMVMDYVEGETLADYIKRTAQAGQFPSQTDIIRLFASIGKAIDYAHQEGMIHRDIKPANILLDKRRTADNAMGEPVLTDFGIAKIVGASSETMTGIVLGTPLYISPEQALGHPASERSDIYSLGVILYEICAGVCPFRGDSAAVVLAQHVNSPPPSPTLINPAIPPPLAEVILRAIAKDPAERFSSAFALATAIAEACDLTVPAGLSLPIQPADHSLGTTRARPHESTPSSRGTQESQLSSVKTSLSIAASITSSPIPTSRRSGRTWKGKLIAWVAVLFVLASSILVSIYLLSSVHASLPTVGTLTFTNSGQYDPKTTVGYNDIVTLSLHISTTPQTGNAYFAWLLPDRGDDETVPMLLGSLLVKDGNATLRYDSPAHTNLLVQYSGVRITEQQALGNPSNLPSQDPKTWRWEGWLPNTPNPNDPKHYSLLNHLRHLLAKDPTLQENAIQGGLVIWMTRNAAKVEEWSSGAQGSWGDGNADLIRRHLLRILDYLDGQTYVWNDVPVGSPWLVDPQAGKLGLLSYTQGQVPPGYLQHVDIHLTGLVSSPGHTDEQKQVATQADGVISRMINDLTLVRKDAIELVQRSDARLLQPDALTLLNQTAALTMEVNSGWFDATTHENVGGAIWLNTRIQ